MRWIAAILVLYLTSCANDKQTGVSKYIYQDDNFVYHIDESCARLRHGKDENGHEIYGKHPIDTADFVITNEEYFRVCTNCVGDKEYEHLIRLSNRNSPRQKPPDGV